MSLHIGKALLTCQGRAQRGQPSVSLADVKAGLGSLGCCSTSQTWGCTPALGRLRHSQELCQQMNIQPQCSSPASTLNSLFPSSASEGAETAAAAQSSLLLTRSQAGISPHPLSHHIPSLSHYPISIIKVRLFPFPSSCP